MTEPSGMVIFMLGAAAATYAGHVVTGYFAEKRWRRQIEDRLGPIPWSESEFVSALKLTTRFPVVESHAHKPDDPA